MAIILKLKAYCNATGILSNKGKKLKKNKIPKLLIESSKIAVKYPEQGIVILRPLVDRLCFGFAVTEEFLAKYDPGQDLDKYKIYVVHSLYHEGMVNSCLGVSIVHKKTGNDTNKYRFRYKPPSGNGEGIFLQFTPKAKMFLRVDMNPSRFSAKALSEFRNFLNESFAMPCDDLLATAKIYRLDVAVDVLGARPADLEVTAMTEKGPIQAKTRVYRSKTGRTETLYLMLKKGKNKSSTEYFYDKRQEQLDGGKVPEYGEFLHTRYECRVQDTAFHKLPNIKNRCARVSVRALDYSKYRKMSYTRRLFARYALERQDAERALEPIPEKTRPKYRQPYEEAMRNAWDAKKIWQFWSDALKPLEVLFKQEA